MAVLEPAEVRLRNADKALVTCRDKSVTKFDQLLRAQQVKPATRSTYLWMLVRLKHQIKTQADLIDLTETELLQAISQVADKAKGSGFQTFGIALKRFYTVMGREDLAKKIRIPRRTSKMPEILTADQIRELIESAGCPDGSLRNRLIVELLWESAARIGELCSLRLEDVQFEQHAAALFLNGEDGSALQVGKRTATEKGTGCAGYVSSHLTEKSLTSLCSAERPSRPCA
jgi:site-specific recombinase XerD